MNIKDELYAVVDPDGKRYAGWNNRMCLFDTKVGAKCYLRKAYLYSAKFTKDDLKIVKVTMVIV